jgi:hypothetical protein
MGSNTEGKKEEIRLLTSDLILLPFNYDTAILNQLPILTLTRKDFERIDGIKIYSFS